MDIVQKIKNWFWAWFSGNLLWELFRWVIFPAGGATVTAGGVSQYSGSLSNQALVLYLVGFFLLFLFLTPYIFKIIQSICEKIIGSMRFFEVRQRGGIILPGLEFAVDRDALTEIRGFREQLFQSNKIDAAFLTNRPLLGFSKEPKVIERIKRLVLPHPQSFWIREMQNHLYGHGTTMQDDIVKVTKLAISNGVDVKWCEQFWGFSWMIGKSNQDEVEWIVYEIINPYGIEKARPAFRLMKSEIMNLLGKNVNSDRFVNLFEEAHRAYGKLHDKSIVPPQEILGN